MRRLRAWLVDMERYAELWGPGRVVAVRYVGDPMWHQRCLIKKATTKQLVEMYPEEPDAMASAFDWWILTPDGDVYIETFESADVSGVAVRLDDNVYRGGNPRLGALHVFDDSLEAGQCDPRAVLGALTVASGRNRRETS